MVTRTHPFAFYIDARFRATCRDLSPVSPCSAPVASCTCSVRPCQTEGKNSRMLPFCRVMSAESPWTGNLLSAIFFAVSDPVAQALQKTSCSLSQCSKACGMFPTPVLTQAFAQTGSDPDMSDRWMRGENRPGRWGAMSACFSGEKRRA
jgi:hypothetical protein